MSTSAYATGTETINAYRAYFAFLDELADKSAAGTSIRIVLDGVTTGVGASPGLITSQGVCPPVSAIFNHIIAKKYPIHSRSKLFSAKIT